tara:strand:+ start:1751 stop:1930 length:180 start_codon:yes stop_codon:yes gene_type:complete
MIITEKNGNKMYNCQNDNCDTLVYAPSRDFMLKMCPHCGHSSHKLLQVELQIMPDDEEE